MERAQQAQPHARVSVSACVSVCVRACVSADVRLPRRQLRESITLPATLLSAQPSPAPSPSSSSPRPFLSTFHVYTLSLLRLLDTFHQLHPLCFNAQSSLIPFLPRRQSTYADRQPARSTSLHCLSYRLLLFAECWRVLSSSSPIRPPSHQSFNSPFVSRHHHIHHPS